MPPWLCTFHSWCLRRCSCTSPAPPLSSSWKILSWTLRPASAVPSSWAFSKFLAEIEQFVLQFCRAALYVQNKQMHDAMLRRREIIPASYETCRHPAFTMVLSVGSHGLWGQRRQSNAGRSQRAGAGDSETSGDLSAFVWSLTGHTPCRAGCRF